MGASSAGYNLLAMGSKTISVLKKLANEDYCYVTTTGRVNRRPHPRRDGLPVSNYQLPCGLDTVSANASTYSTPHPR